MAGKNRHLYHILVGVLQVSVEKDAEPFVAEGSVEMQLDDIGVSIQQGRSEFFVEIHVVVEHVVVELYAIVLVLPVGGEAHDILLFPFQIPIKFIVRKMGEDVVGGEVEEVEVAADTVVLFFV